MSASAWQRAALCQSHGQGNDGSCVSVKFDQELVAFSFFQPTAIFVNNVRKLIEAFAVILSTNYCVVFVTMIVIYNKLLKYIKKIRLDGGNILISMGSQMNN